MSDRSAGSDDREPAGTIVEGGDGTAPADPAEGPSSDEWRALASILLFSFALGVAALALPLLALDAGYDAATVGFLTATSAITHLGLRLQLPRLLSRFPDRGLIALSAAMMATAFLLLIGSTALPVFIVAQLFQGGARALFWTASQTHAVRTPGVPVRMLARVGAAGNFGNMIGPVVTGIVASVSIVAALGLGVAASVVAAVIALTLRRLEPYARRTAARSGRLWLKPGIDVGCWAAWAGGGWRAMMNSYVPVVLATAGLPTGIIGGLVSMGDLAATITITALVRIPPRFTRPSLLIGVIATGTGLALLPLFASQAALAAVLIALSGAGAGPLPTLAAEAARQQADPSDEGEVIALVGTFRAVALLVTPAGIAASLAIAPLGAAIAVAGIATALPTVALSAWRRA